MRDEFNRWWQAQELSKGNHYIWNSPAWWAFEGWIASRREKPDCKTCANRGRVDGLSQETHCDHCMHQERWRTDHYAPNARVNSAAEGSPATERSES